MARDMSSVWMKSRLGSRLPSFRMRAPARTCFWISGIRCGLVSLGPKALKKRPTVVGIPVRRWNSLANFSVASLVVP